MFWRWNLFELRERKNFIENLTTGNMLIIFKRINQSENSNIKNLKKW